MIDDDDDTRGRIPVHGEPTPPYRVVRLGLNGQPIATVDHFDSLDAAIAKAQARMDWKCEVWHGRARVWPAPKN